MKNRRSKVSTPSALPWSLRIPAPLFKEMWAHLFPGDDDEHGVVLSAGIVQTPEGTRLLARDLFLAQDGVDYVPGTHGYRALTARFVADKALYCGTQELCYLAVHCHGGRDRVAFSRDDLDSHQRGYPAILDITDGGPVGALVFAQNAAAGNIWTREGQVALSHVEVVGPQIQKLYPRLPRYQDRGDPTYDRQSLMFGEAGQRVLRGLKVGVIGLGGAGSLINEMLARLGVGHIVGVDFDVVERSNLPRIVGATRTDVRRKRRKIEVAERVARAANPSIIYEGITGNVADQSVAQRLRDVDFLFLAADSMQSRLVFNALVHGFLIPSVQVGAKVEVDAESGDVSQIFAVSRPVLPFAGGGCLLCQGLIPPARLQEEALREDERKAQRYVEDEIAAPSVITLNALATSQAVNDFLMMFTQLFEDEVELHQTMHRVRERIICPVKPLSEPACRHCGQTPKSILAYGDRRRLPCRATTK